MKWLDLNRETEKFEKTLAHLFRQADNLLPRTAGQQCPRVKLAYKIHLAASTKMSVKEGAVKAVVSGNCS